MGFLKRIKTTIQYDFIPLAETDEGLEFLRLSLQNMIEDSMQLRQLVEAALIRQEQIDHECRQILQTLEDFQLQAEAALINHDDYSAREALLDKRDGLKKAQATRLQLQKYTRLIRELQPLLNELEYKIDVVRCLLPNDDDLDDIPFGSKKPKHPPDGTYGAQADPLVDGQAISIVP